MIEIDFVKKYGRIEHDFEDEVLAVCIDAAVNCLNIAGVSEDTEVELYKLAVARLALHYYENRGELSNTKIIPMGMDTMIEQLRNS